MRRSSSVFAIGMIAVLAMGSLGGCGGKEEPKKPTTTTDPNGAPPPTPEELARKAISELGLDQPLPPPGTRMTPAMRDTTLDAYKKKTLELSRTPEGKIALDQVQKVLEDRIAAFEGGKFWEHTVTYVDAYAMFQPKSKKYEQLKEKALTEMRKPRVTLKGLPEVSGEKVAQVVIYIPLTSETFSERLSTGEEMHGVKFLGVFGKNRGARMEYLETGERFVAYLPSQK